MDSDYQHMSWQDNATVYDLFTEALSDAGLTFHRCREQLCEARSTPRPASADTRSSEFTNGKNSGWMYTINGSHPNYGLKEQDTEGW